MKKELPKAYEPKKYEDKIYKNWEESGYFNPDKIKPKNDSSYTIVMPPPNRTGVLHMGHAAMLAIEDILIRYHRMKGDRTLWLPGTDHAAIATQTKVEKIIKEEGTSRHKLGREKFLERVVQFAQESHDTIVSQIKKMGSSCDWSREAYTLDEVRNKAVRNVFKMMYDDGLIYRGERMVNWCPRCHSTLADDEVEYKKQKAKLYTFKYGQDFPFAIATTRPETKLGDTAVAVNPKDPRYKEFVGKTYEVNFVGIPLKIKIIADRQIDMEFGTGALGVTPAHSAVDWQMAEENNLEIIKVIDEDGKIHSGFNEYSGKNVFEARKMIVKKLEEQGLLEKEEEFENNLSLCYRCDTPVEPLPSLQWFIDVNKKIPRLGKSIKELSVEAVRKGVFGREKIKIVPERFEKNYYNWMENLRDWCISRQIWFGHQVPVWYKGDEIYAGVDAPREDGWMQDPDTLDTWFSSGLWTFSTLANSPEQISIENGKLKIDSEDFKNFHPTAVLETGYDILFFWVARMIIMTTYAVQDIPFQDVYLHGLVLDEKGKKMSKSKGNVIDPLDMCEKYGTDATRLSLVIGSTPGNDMRLSEEKVAGFRNFVNKLWNISRFIVSNYDIKIETEKINPENCSLADLWILEKMRNLISSVSEDINNYRFSQVGENLREFTWGDLADWYIEVSKFEKSGEKEKILSLVLQDLLKLWHSFIPFVTEKIWQEIDSGRFLLIEEWPKTEKYSDAVGLKDSDLLRFEIVKDIISAIRNARAEHKVEPSKKISAVIYAGPKKELIESQVELIKNLRTGIEKLEIKDKGEKIEKAVYLTVSGVEVYLLGAIDEEKEKQRLEKEIAILEKLINSINTKLSNKDFVSKAPKNIVDQEKKRLSNYQKELDNLNSQLNN